jgi:hypothetical protein
MNVASVPEVRMAETEMMRIPAYECMSMMEDDSDERCLLSWGFTSGAFLLLHLQTFKANIDHAYDDEKMYSLREGLEDVKEPFSFTSRISQAST